MIIILMMMMMMTMTKLQWRIWWQCQRLKMTKRDLTWGEHLSLPSSSTEVFRSLQLSWIKYIFGSVLWSSSPHRTLWIVDYDENEDDETWSKVSEWSSAFGKTFPFSSQPSKTWLCWLAWSADADADADAADDRKSYHDKTVCALNINFVQSDLN